MMRMDDPPDDGKPVGRVTFTVACLIIGAATFVVVFYLAALALLPG